MMSHRIAASRAGLLAMITAVALSAALGGASCGDDLPSDQTTSSSSSGGGSAVTTTATTSIGGAGGGSSCFANPTTHLEIINACTDAEQVDVTPVLPLLTPDGGLPPLP